MNFLTMKEHSLESIIIRKRLLYIFIRNLYIFVYKEAPLFFLQSSKSVLLGLSCIYFNFAPNYPALTGNHFSDSLKIVMEKSLSQ